MKRFHHARIYRFTSNGVPTYAMVRVYDYDLRKYRGVDVFNVGLKPQTLSMRQSVSRLRKAIAEGSAEYLGWIAVGDEIYVDTTGFHTDLINDLRDFVGDISRWRVDGFDSNSKLRLHPAQLSEEGLQGDENANVKTAISKKSNGWRPSVNRLFGSGQITIVRRNSLGQERWKSNSHLPVCWEVKF